MPTRTPRPAKPVNEAARALVVDTLYRPRVVKVATAYTRKPKHPKRNEENT